MLKAFILVFGILVGSWVFAHGEDKPGPHQGFIKMPGAYHTEVVAAGDRGLKVYLLDMEWKNPQVANSSVNATFKSGKAISIPAKCETGKDHFICYFSKGVTLKGPGQIVIESTRDGQKGNAAIYDLPLTLPGGPGAAAPGDPHAGH